MSQKVLDEWEVALQQQKIVLEKCQQEHQVSSCLQCKELLSCEIRDTYVKAVYDSMNKGTGGGFEF